MSLRDDVGDRLSLLLLCDHQRGNPNTINDHITAFKRFSRHRVELFNPRGIARSRFLDLDQFDIVVIHYSLVLIWDDYVSPGLRDQIEAYDGLKVQFLQDEYRLVDDITAEMRRLGIDILYSVVPPEQVPAVYGDRLPETEILPTLTGYASENLNRRTAPATAARPIDVGYRGRSTPLWLGRLGYEKIQIGRGFLEHAHERGLQLDIAWTENARIYGERWIDFMTSCRTMLASESGSSIVDFDGSAERDVRAYLAAHPTADYEEVERAVLRRYEGGPVINTSSPRLFEAAALRTGMVVHPGEYSRLIQPWEHYIPLEKDFSNIDDVIEHVRDVGYVEDMAQRAHEELIASGKYSERSFVQEFDDAVAARVPARRRHAKFPRRRLQLEQIGAGRSYHVSTFYAGAREVLLLAIGGRAALRSRPLRRLAGRALRRRGHADATTLWDDVFRLAVLTSVHEGKLELHEPFAVVPTYDADTRRLVLTSRLGVPAPTENGAGLLDAVRRHGIAELVWNHAAVGQFVSLPIPGLRRRVSFDVGRYDAYGVYRFDELTRLAEHDPTAVANAIAPLVVPSAAAAAYRSAADESKATTKG